MISEYEYVSIAEQLRTPAQAREQLAALTRALAPVRTTAGADVLAADYYLPMFDAAMAAHQFRVADALRQQLDDSGLNQAMLPLWWSLNFQLDFHFGRYEQAEAWCQKNMSAMGDDVESAIAAMVFHELGLIEQQAGDADAAQQWYERALSVTEARDDRRGSAAVCHQLGRLSEALFDYDLAQEWYIQALELKKLAEDDAGAINTLQQLGNLSLKRRDEDAAETYLREAMGAAERLELEDAAATAYHGMGTLEMRRGHGPAAESWYRKALAIETRVGDELAAASTYSQLGLLAQDRADFKAAEKLYRQALDLDEGQHNVRGAAITLQRLGSLAGNKREYDECGRSFVSSILGSLATNDLEVARRSAEALLDHYRAAPQSARDKIRDLWAEAALGPFPDGSEADEEDDDELYFADIEQPSR